MKIIYNHHYLKMVTSTRDNIRMQLLLIKTNISAAFSSSSREESGGGSMLKGKCRGYRRIFGNRGGRSQAVQPSASVAPPLLSDSTFPSNDMTGRPLILLTSVTFCPLHAVYIHFAVPPHISSLGEAEMQTIL